MKTNNALVNIKGNKDSNINITIGEIDELSPLNISSGKSDIVKLEEAFSNRMGLSCTVLNNNVLPKQLREDFEIKPKIIDDKIEYYTSPKTKDAYEKHPLKMNFSMVFPTVEEANEFKKAGIEKLQEEANKTQKPVKIPYIKNMRELLGEYEDPTSYINKYGWEGSELYIMPKPLPPNQKYCIEIFNGISTFKLNTKLRLTKTSDDGLVLSNQDSLDEPFNVEFKLSEIDKQKIMEEKIEGKFNITISIRENFKYSCLYNLELMKYRFLSNDKRNTIIIRNTVINEDVFKFNNCGVNIYEKKDYDFFNKIVQLLEKVIYISKIKNIDIKYELDYFLKNEEYINLLISEINNENYIINKKTYWTITSDDLNEEELNKADGEISLITTFSNYNLFEKDVFLKDHRVILKNCKILEIKNKKGIKEIKLEANSVLFELL